MLPRVPRWLAVPLALACALASGPAGAQAAPPPLVAPALAPDTPEGPGSTVTIDPIVPLGDLAGAPIARVEVVPVGGRWTQVPAVTLRPGERLTPAVARHAARELLSTGGFARVSIEAAREGAGAVLRLRVLPRRLVAQARVEGSAVDAEELLRELRLGPNAEITSPSLEAALARVREIHASRGWPAATVDAEVRDTDDPLRVALVLRVRPGPERRIAKRRTTIAGLRQPPLPELDELLEEIASGYDVEAGARADEQALLAADRAREEALRRLGWRGAHVGHELVDEQGRTLLFVRVRPGPRIVQRYEGARAFDEAQLDAALDLDHEPDPTPRRLAAKLHDFYVRRGFYDAEVSAAERGGPADRVHVIDFTIREHPQVRVALREYPCLAGGPLTPREVGREIDSFLEEDLPGALVGPVDPAVVDSLLGPRGNTGARPTPVDVDPARTFVESSYDRAIKHVQDYLRSEGYLSAMVGPLLVERRQCDRRSPPGRCIPLPLPPEPTAVCGDAMGLPVEQPAPDPRLTCVPDPARGVACEPWLKLRLPIQLGPRTTLWDVAFEGGERLAALRERPGACGLEGASKRRCGLVEADLAREAALVLGDPVSQVGVEEARKRVLDAIREQGFAFAEVRTALDLSPDRTRARVRFIVSEGERVVVDDVVVRGARRTDPALVLKRTTFTRCPHETPPDACVPFRPSAVRESEENIATLGVFSSVSIGLEDPSVPARRKVVVVQVQERLPQYLDIRPGFSTGEGFRIAFEYGHGNVAGKAIQLTLRVQLAYLPDPFILDPDVRTNFDRLPLGQRLERRDTVSLVFPEIGLGPRFRLGLDGVDVRDNARDYGLTKQAGVATLTYRGARTWWLQTGASLERNDVRIFNGDTVQAYLSQPGITTDVARLLRAPDGTTVAASQRVGATWDRRDRPLGATRGTLLIAGVEHVHAFPAEDNPNTIVSDFLRLTGTASIYLPLGRRGSAFAISVRGGRILQVTADSKTYPDRLFFLGGVDSLRGFLQDSLVPEDVAEQILAPENQAKAADDPKKLRIEQVALRGGDLFLNPRAELRLPLGGMFESGLFLDTGNLWVDPRNFAPLKLRYAAGPGLRVATPIGPVAFDYGINLDRRPWEDFGAFHFSIGLF